MSQFSQIEDDSNLSEKFNNLLKNFDLFHYAKKKLILQ